jgi:hypothetical protein
VQVLSGVSLECSPQQGEWWLLKARRMTTQCVCVSVGVRGNVIRPVRPSLPQHTLFTFSSFMAWDTLSFVDARFIAYNKYSDNNTHTPHMLATRTLRSEERMIRSRSRKPYTHGCHRPRKATTTYPAVYLHTHAHRSRAQGIGEKYNQCLST